MSRKQISIFPRITIAILVSLTVLFIFPYLKHFSVHNISLLMLGDKDFNFTLARTILNALMSAIVLTSFSFYGALAIRNVSLQSALGRWLSVLILPVTLGNVTTAFICKLTIGESYFFSQIAEGGIVGKLSLFNLLQIWQFGTLFIYLFWLNFQGISSAKMQYLKVNRFSFYQSVKDVYLPHARNLAILISVLGFVFTFYEEAKLKYLFKVSQGTDSELISNWLTRNYQSALLVNPVYSRDLLFKSGSVVTIFAVLCLIGVFATGNITLGLVTRSKYYPTHKETAKPSKSYGTVAAWTLFMIVLTPVIWSLAKIHIKVSNELMDLGFSLMMTFAATIVSVFLAISFGISARLGLRLILSSFNNKSLIFFILFFMLMLIPPIVLLICGYNWMGILGYQSDWMIYLAWILGHAILALPVMGSFVLFNHFQVTERELNYQSASGVSLFSLIKFSFLKRFKAQYFFLFFICNSFIWNEASFNSLFSDYIPSFSARLEMLITGRAADYSQAFGYLFVSFLLGVVTVLIWYWTLYQHHRSVKTL